MARYLMNFDTRELPTRRTECLVIGSGVAGMTTAVHLARAGHDVLLVVRDTLLDSNTNKAQGGIAAVMGKDDNAALHLADTLVAGAGLSDEAVSRMVVTEGPADIRWLIENGAEFDRREDGSLLLGREGCHSRNRIVHAHGDATGAEVARSLHAMVQKESKISVLEGCYVADLLVEQQRCYGAVALYQGRKLVLRARQVVLATGGCGRLFQHTTNPEGATGSGIALAYRAGAEVQDMEFVQFHPTALALDGCPNFLISEAVRGAGAILRNPAGERFMPKYHEMAELAPRDVVARCIFKEMQLAGSDFLYLDARHIERVQEKFPMIARTCYEYGVDIAKDFIPIAPAAHYMMGGVKTDEWGRTNITGLYACGEAACTGLQGANRLASNSLLEGLVFGRRVAVSIGKSRLPQEDTGLHWQSENLAEPKGSFVLGDIQKSLEKAKEIMSHNLGITREATELAAAGVMLETLREIYAETESQSVLMLDLQNELLTDWLIMKAAQRRQESRGAHYRTDFPESREEYRKHFHDQRKEEKSSQRTVA